MKDSTIRKISIAFNCFCALLNIWFVSCGIIFLLNELFLFGCFVNVLAIINLIIATKNLKRYGVFKNKH